MADVTHVRELQGLKLDRTTIDTLQLNIGLYCNLVRARCTSVLCWVKPADCDRAIDFHAGVHALPRGELAAAHGDDVAGGGGALPVPARDPPVPHPP